MKDWGAREFHRRFSEPLSHTSLTVEESLRSDRPRVHLHTQLTFRKRIDRKHLGSQIAMCVLQTCCSHSPECLRNMTCFQFQNIWPHVEVNSARGSDVEASRARARAFFSWCGRTSTSGTSSIFSHVPFPGPCPRLMCWQGNKRGTLWVYTD